MRIVPIDFDILSVIEDPRYRDVLFLFCDNVEDHLTDRFGWSLGRIRPYNSFGKHYNPPRSAGIVIGYDASQDFVDLSDEVKSIIDSSIEEVKKLIIKYRFRRIMFYSSDLRSFMPKNLSSETISNYIDKSIYSLGSTITELPHR